MHGIQLIASLLAPSCAGGARESDEGWMESVKQQHQQLNKLMGSARRAVVLELVDQEAVERVSELLLSGEISSVPRV
jgi:hypothetical protein